MSQNTVVYLAVDKDGTETAFEYPPRKEDLVRNVWYTNADSIELPTGTIKKLTGKDLTWKDGYIQYVGDNYDPTLE